MLELWFLVLYKKKNVYVLLSYCEYALKKYFFFESKDTISSVPKIYKDVLR